MRIGLAAQCVASTHALCAAIATHLQERICCELFRFNGRPILGVVPANAGTQYSRAFLFIHRRSGILGRPVEPGDDIGTHLLILATAFCPSLSISFAPLRKEGAGKDRVRAAPAVSCAMGSKEDAHEQTGSAETLRPSLRNGLTAYAVLSLVTGFLTPSPPGSANLPGT